MFCAGDDTVAGLDFAIWVVSVVVDGIVKLIDYLYNSDLLSCWWDGYLYEPFRCER